jgi:hypothetical protein
MQLLRHVWKCRPSFIACCFGAAAWSSIVAACVLADYLLWRHMLPPATIRVLVIFAGGAALAAPLSLWLTTLLRHKNWHSIFAAAFVSLSLTTVTITALIFAFDFWWYFSHWHGAVFSRLWTNQFIFTFASAIYQFLVSGLRLYLPFDLIALVLASLWASKRMMR